MITNSEIANIFSQTADLLEIKGENPFKVRAYRNAARLIENSSKDFNKLVKENFDLTKLPGIGNDLSKAIKEIVNTGKFLKLEKLKKEIPSGLIDMLSIEGLGPKRIKQIYDAFHITSLNELKKFAQNGELDKLPGFGETLINKILKGVKQLKKAGIRFLWADVENIAKDLRKYLLKFPEVEIVEIAGSYRRKKETVGDLDILVVAEDYPKVSEYFVKYKRVKEVHSAGLTRSTVFLDNDLQIDLRAVNKESYGAALHYFTGSKAHNIEIRKMALEKEMKVNEYGVYKEDKKIAGKTEEELYKSLGLCYIEPELRENRGEIEACINKSLPSLITMQDIKGDLNISSAFIDEAVKMGYKYVGVRDKKVKRNDIKVYRFLEVDVSNLKISEEYDFLVGIVKENAITEEILESMNKVKFLRFFRDIKNKKEVNVDFDKIFNEMQKRDIALEIISRPNNLINEVLIKSAITKGVRISIVSNAKTKEELNFIKYGVNQARRGWAEVKNVINSQNNLL